MSSTPSTTQPQAKISQKLVVRTLIGLVLLAILFGAYRWFQNVDLEYLDTQADTAGMVAAIQFLDEGQKAVVFKPDGTIIENRGHAAGTIDRDLVWQPDGNRLFFVSDRGESKSGAQAVKAFNIFGWNPVANDEPNQRTIGTRGSSYPSFADEKSIDQNKTALITSGGFVLEFNPKDRSTRQVLPPLGREVSTSESDEGGAGTDSQFGAAYGKLGNSFRIAKWLRGKQFIAAVIRRDAGEILVIQPMTEKDGRFPPPRPVVAGSRIDISVSPKDGSLAYSVQDFQFPDPDRIPEEFRQGNKITRPFAHMIGVLDPEKQPEPPVAASPNDQAAFGTPVFSPDGASVALTIGEYKDGAMSPKALIVMPARTSGGQAGARLILGEVYEPSWHPSGNSLVYIKRDPDGKRSVYTVNKDGSGERSLSGGRGNFAYPTFSPQSK